jgi:hypothetical protein
MGPPDLLTSKFRGQGHFPSGSAGMTLRGPTPAGFFFWARRGQGRLRETPDRL